MDLSGRKILQSMVESNLSVGKTNVHGNAGKNLTVFGLMEG